MRRWWWLVVALGCSGENDSQPQPDPCSRLGPDAGPDAEAPPPECNPLTQTCGGGEKCTVAEMCPDNPFCRGTGSLLEGDDCSPSNDQCQSRLVCAFWLQAPECRRFCSGNFNCTTTGFGVCDRIPGSDDYNACRP